METKRKFITYKQHHTFIREAHNKFTQVMQQITPTTSKDDDHTAM
jgi:hypothetical protein